MQHERRLESFFLSAAKSTEPENELTSKDVAWW
jgi:hypothetical protein